MIIEVFALLLIILCYYSLKDVIYRKILLCVCSILFYLHIYNLVSTFFLSAFAVFAVWISRCQTNNRWKIFIYVFMGTISHLFLKYCKCETILLPVGFSVIIFNGISLIVDSYKNNGVGTSWIDGFLYMLYFPKMLAGPFVKKDFFQKQTDYLKTFSKRSLYINFKIILFATFLKLIICETIIDVGFTGECGINSIIQIILFGIYLYLDFWSYSLLAIGISGLFSIGLPDNFIHPYSSCSFKDFWNRWNLTLSFWLKEYVYIPMGGNRVSPNRWRVNIIMVFLVSGLWHGITIPFIIWGVIHGALIVFERLLQHKRIIDIQESSLFYKFFVITTVFFLWQLFLLPDLHSVGELIVRMTDFHTNPNLHLLATCFSIFVLFLMIHTEKFKKLIRTYGESKQFVIGEVAICSFMLICLLLFSYDMNAPFFYLKF